MHGTDYYMAKTVKSIDPVKFYRGFTKEVLEATHACYAYSDVWSMIDKRKGMLAPKTITVSINGLFVSLDRYNIPSKLAAIAMCTIAYLMKRARECQTYNEFYEGYFVKVNHAL